MYSRDASHAFTSTGLFYRGVRAEPGQVTMLRQALDRWLGRLRLGAEVGQDVLLASYEALANVVEHAYSDGHGDRLGAVDLEAVYRPDECSVEVIVTDHGRWRTPDDASGDSCRGRGLALIRTLTSHTDVVSVPDGTSVTMKWDVSGCAALVAAP
ncbi:ATP-binding protein [Rhodococcus indonesiensis]|uniref:ATP-binding protein n=1 Tax=Rhodococcus indonesiensis TaxID=3055869 RepID=UPI0039F69268